MTKLTDRANKRRETVELFATAVDRLSDTHPADPSQWVLDRLDVSDPESQDHFERSKDQYAAWFANSLAAAGDRFRDLLVFAIVEGQLTEVLQRVAFQDHQAADPDCADTSAQKAKV